MIALEAKLMKRAMVAIVRVGAKIQTVIANSSVIPVINTKYHLVNPPKKILRNVPKTPPI